MIVLFEKIIMLLKDIIVLFEKIDYVFERSDYACFGNMKIYNKLHLPLSFPYSKRLFDRFSKFNIHHSKIYKEIFLYYIIGCTFVTLNTSIFL